MPTVTDPLPEGTTRVLMGGGQLAALPADVWRTLAVDGRRVLGVGTLRRDVIVQLEYEPFTRLYAENSLLEVSRA